jgi:hypothetical protein
MPSVMLFADDVMARRFARDSVYAAPKVRARPIGAGLELSDGLAELDAMQLASALTDF